MYKNKKSTNPRFLLFFVKERMSSISMVKKTAFGFTLIETVVTVGIFALVMLTITSSVLYFYRVNANAIEQAFAINSSRRGIEFTVRDIREITYADNGAYPVMSIGSTTLSFYSDIDRDSSVELVRYFLNGDILQKGVTKATGDPAVYNTLNEVVSVISTDVRNVPNAIPIFRYFDNTGTEVTNFTKVTDVAFVNITLIININPSRLPEDFTLQSSATLRNLKINL